MVISLACISTLTLTVEFSTWCSFLINWNSFRDAFAVLLGVNAAVGGQQGCTGTVEVSLKIVKVQQYMFAVPILIVPALFDSEQLSNCS